MKCNLITYNYLGVNISGASFEFLVRQQINKQPNPVSAWPETIQEPFWPTSRIMRWSVDSRLGVRLWSQIKSSPGRGPEPHFFILHQLHHLNLVWKISSECKSCVMTKQGPGSITDIDQCGSCVRCFGFAGNKNIQTSFFCLSNNRVESRVSTGHTNLHVTFKQPPENQKNRESKSGEPSQRGSHGGFT